MALSTGLARAFAHAVRPCFVQQSRGRTAWAKAESEIVPTPQRIGRLCPPYVSKNSSVAVSRSVACGVRNRAALARSSVVA